MLLILVSLMLLSACDEIAGGIEIGGSSETGSSIVTAGSSVIEGILMSEEQHADERMEQIMTAINNKDREALESLFSKEALDEADDFDNEIDYLFDFLEGNLVSWERDGWASSKSIEYGKKSVMIRFVINVNTDVDAYQIFVIDYSTDTINPDNEGVYMLEVKLTDSDNLGSWQDRMRAGIYIH